MDIFLDFLMLKCAVCGARIKILTSYTLLSWFRKHHVYSPVLCHEPLGSYSYFDFVTYSDPWVQIMMVHIPTLTISECGYFLGFLDVEVCCLWSKDQNTDELHFAVMV